MSHTCSRCHATWSGANIAHCAGCCETFSTVANFDRHRQDFACVPPASVGLEVRDGLWRMPPTDASRARIAAFTALRQSDEHADSASECQPAIVEAPGAPERVSSS